MRAAESGFLLIDISNSFTKLALSSADKLGRVQRIPTALLSEKRLFKAIGKLRGRVAVVSSVVPAAEKVVRAFLRKTVVIRVNAQAKLGVGVDYPRPRTIGADRLANAASAVAFYGAPVIVVDFGTAVTFDIISAERNYIGGVICPGLEVMTDYLYQRTALLPKINLLEPMRAVGKSTRDAMLAGAVFGYRGLVKEVVAQIKREISPRRKITVVATGGYAELIARGLPEIHHVHPALTMEGLRIIGVLNA